MVVDCSGFIEPLNLECLLVNTFAGSITLFIMIAVIAIAMIGASFRMINATLLIIYVLFAIIMATFIGSAIYFLILLIGGLVVAVMLSRILKR